jgi:hypothetical protein
MQANESSHEFSLLPYITETICYLVSGGVT